MTCAHGAFATQLPQLAIPPTTGGASFISPDLGIAAVVEKSGYSVEMQAGGDGTASTLDACNGVAAAQLSSTFYATATPTALGATGSYYYWLGVAGTIFFDIVPIASTDGLDSTPGGTPIQ
jgi:hypothetical protein